MKNKFVLGLVVIVLMIGSILSVSALNPFNSGWQSQIGKKSILHAYDVNCPKGMIAGRVYDLGTHQYNIKCVWPGSGKNKDKNNGVGLNVENSPAEENNEGSSSDENGSEDSSGGSGSEDDEGGCEGDDNDCEEEEVCEVVKEKVWKETCVLKKGKLHCNHGWVWEDKTVCKVIDVCEE
jgi:hypothetical protein